MRYESCVWNETVAYNLEIRWVEGGDLFERGADGCGKGGYEIRGRGGRGVGGGAIGGLGIRGIDANSTVFMECVSWVCEIDDLSTLDSDVRYILEQS